MLSMNAWMAIAIGGGGVCLFMLALWVLQQRTRDASVVDVGWAASLGFLAVWFAVVGQGAVVHRVLVGVLGGLWGMRLAAYLLWNRVIGKSEDRRYQALRAEWGASAGWKFFLFFQAQGILAVLLAAPFAAGSYNPAERAFNLEWLAVVVWIGALVGETVADRQLARFRARNDNSGRTCRDGLWRYSRHPNYFFEWLIWCAFALLAWPAPWGWTGVLTAAVMLFLILKVTGIPPTEAQALRSRGDDYRKYQRTTSPFVPWFPKEEATA